MVMTTTMSIRVTTKLLMDCHYTRPKSNLSYKDT